MGIKSKIYNYCFALPLAVIGGRPDHGIPLPVVSWTPALGYDEEPAIKAAITKVATHSMISFERMASLWQQVRYLDRYSIQGQFVECGVWKGGAAGMMALAHLASVATPWRSLYLFDSFEGLPEPVGLKDGSAAVRYAGNRASGKLRPIGQCVGTLDENRELLERRIGYPEPLLRYHVGWFEETLPRVAPEIGEIALLRLDGDWYESTRICLEHLYSRVVKGGVVVIDDYGHWEGCRRAVDEFIAALSEPVLLNHIDYSARYWIRSL
jgi:O-methyltransferase